MQYFDFDNCYFVHLKGKGRKRTTHIPLIISSRRRQFGISWIAEYGHGGVMEASDVA